MKRRVRGYLRGCVCGAVFGAAIGDVHAQSAESQIWTRPTLSFYGTPGLIDMPSGYAMPDGETSLSLGGFGDISRAVFNFQITPRLGGSFRYSNIEGFLGPGQYFDRSFDLYYQIAQEGLYSPAVMIGLRDFGGTGIYSGEYVAASKTFGRLQTTAGIGWGRLGSYNGFSNPLRVLSNRFKGRPDGGSGIGQTGKVDTGDWFRGDAALFGGIQYQATERLLLTAEYSSDAYDEETSHIGFEHKSPVNVAATYRFRNGIDMSAAYLYGSYTGVLLSYSFNPKIPPHPEDGREGQGPRVVPRSSATSLGWTGYEAGGASDTLPGSPNTAVGQALAAQGIHLVALEQRGDQVIVHMRNDRYQAEAEAVGRAARALTGVLSPQIATITLVPMRNGVAMSAVTVQRSDLEELEHDLDGSWKSYSRAEIEDAKAYPLHLGTPGTFPQFRYSVDGFWGPTFSNPDSFLAEGGLRFKAAYEPLPGLILSTELRQPLIQISSGATPTGGGASKIPHVRTDAGLYENDKDFELRELQADYFFRPGNNLYGRLTAGYLEEMYGGISSELLWNPVSGPLAVGAEMNYVRKRSPDDLFGFADYEVATGHISAYYDFGNGYLGQIDAGRYLAGDWGTTLSMDREFANGFTLGAYITLTDVSSEDFGEGSFDKGIRFSIPVTWLLGDPSRRNLATSLRPINGDGGARLQVSTRLYDMIRGGQASELQEDWGRFWR